MKFTKNRLLSLLLVLAMMLALVPSVFAVTHDDTHTLVWQLKDSKHVQVCTTPGCAVSYTHLTLPTNSYV